MFALGRSSRATMPLSTGSAAVTKTIGIVRVGSGRWRRACHDDVGLQADQILRQRPYPIDVTAAPSKVHSHVAPIGPTQVRKGLREHRDASPRDGIVFTASNEHADPAHALGLLRPCNYWPRCRGPEPRNELPPSHP
jgi:hypothetical protein